MSKLVNKDPMNGIKEQATVAVFETAPLNLCLSGTAEPVEELKEDLAIVKGVQSASSGSEYDGQLEAESADSDNTSQHSPNNNNIGGGISTKKPSSTKRKFEVSEGVVGGNTDETVTNKRRKQMDDVTSECSDSCDQSQTDNGKSGNKEPSDHLLGYNLFVRKLVDKTLNRSVTFCEQPKSKITALEAACKRQFPEFADDLHRTKIRCYLKACRRNAKKQYNRACNREGGSSVIGDFNEYTSSLASSPSSPSYNNSTAKNLPAHMATTKAKEITAKALEQEEEFILKINQMKSEENSITGSTHPTPDPSEAANSHQSSSGGGGGAGGLASIPSSFTLFPFLPFLPEAGNGDLSNLPALHPPPASAATGKAAAANSPNTCTANKSNGFTEEKFGEFLQANFWRSVEMVKAMRLSAGFILMSAQKIEDALMVESSSPWQPERSSSTETNPV